MHFSEYVSCLWGFELTAEGLEPYHGSLHVICGCMVGLGPACLGRLRFRRSRLVQARPSSSPPLALVRFHRPPLFFALSLSGFALCGLGVLVLVFSLSSFLLLRSPSRVPVKQFLISSSFSSHFHPLFIHMFISCSGP